MNERLNENESEKECEVTCIEKDAKTAFFRYFNVCLTDRQTDRPTNRRTDMTLFRCARKVVDLPTLPIFKMNQQSYSDRVTVNYV